VSYTIWRNIKIDYYVWSFEPIQLNFDFEKRFLDKISFYQNIEKSFFPNILNTYGLILKLLFMNHLKTIGKYKK